MQIQNNSKSFFSILTEKSDKFECTEQLKIRGEHGIRLWLRRNDKRPYDSALLFIVNVDLETTFLEASDKCYIVESTSDTQKHYIVIDRCLSKKELMEATLKAILIMKATVMIRNMLVVCDLPSTDM